jgi:hypothetical protein
MAGFGCRKPACPFDKLRVPSEVEGQATAATQKRQIPNLKFQGQPKVEGDAPAEPKA